MAETNQNPVVDSMDHCWNFRSAYLTRFRVYFWQFAHRSACVQVIMFTCVDWIQVFLIPCDVSLPRLGGASWNAAAVVSAVLWGWRVGTHQGGLARARQGRRGTVGLDKTSERRSFEYSSCKQLCWKVLLSFLGCILENPVYTFVS